MLSLKLSKQTILKLKKYYINNLGTSDNKYVDFVINNLNYKITAYLSQKVIFQGRNAHIEHQKWFIAPSFFEHSGSDEVGTGDFFGPIVVCAAYINQNHYQILKKLKIRDSKKISDKKIQILAKKLINFVPYRLLVLRNEKYNKIIQKENMNSIKAKLHNQANFLLAKQIGKTKIIIDQFTTKKSYWNYLKNETNIVYDIILKTKAEDRYLAVAIASIIARYTFLIEMDKLSRQVQTKLLFGAGIKVDNQINLFPENILKKIAKLNFKNYTKRNI